MGLQGKPVEYQTMTNERPAGIDDIENTLTGWAEAELRPWTERRPVWDRSVLEGLNLRPNVFLFDLYPSSVTPWIKPHFSDTRLENTAHPYIHRARLYLNLFRDLVACRMIASAATIALDVEDECQDYRDVPVFTFQKRSASVNLLLPDVDILEAAPPEDRRPFTDKTPTAIFVGSTTGGQHITHEALADDAVPRIRTARYFRDRGERIAIHLPNIVQCADDSVAAALRDEGFGGAPIPWDRQLESRFLISIDGNGATCSRVFVALASNSVLLKYASDNELFYFKGLVPGRHFIPVASDEALEVLSASFDDLGRYEAVAEAGRRFALAYLSRESLLTYSAALLRLYAEWTKV